MIAQKLIEICTLFASVCGGAALYLALSIWIGKWMRTGR